MELTKFKQFKNLLHSKKLEFIMEAHNGLSAKIVEETGFKGIWASGLTISASLGVRDSNEASWTQVLDVLEFMSDATTIPIMLDGDTGYGNFNNFRRLVKKLCRHDIAAVCIEDKLFPKTNSFIGDNQSLADIGEFCGKIKAGNDAKEDDNFSIVARIEALIAGYGIDEALKRAEAYHKAGADAILIHSKQSTAKEIIEFAKKWQNQAPLIIVPTKYYSTPTDEFRKARISMVIWANHNLRASISAIKNVSEKIYKDESLVNVEGEIANLGEIFALTGDDELRVAEDKYLQTKTGSYQAIILAASRGKSVSERLTEDKPKCMIKIKGHSILSRQIKTYNECGIHTVNVVRGYKKESITYNNIVIFDNDKYYETSEAFSLFCASRKLDQGCILSFGDILFRKYILDRLMDVEADIVLVVDAFYQNKNYRAVDLVICDEPYKTDYFTDNVTNILELGNNVAKDKANGRWVGIAKFSKKAASLIKEKLEVLNKKNELAKLDIVSLLNLLEGINIKAIYVTGDWLDINEADDIIDAGNFVS